MEPHSDPSDSPPPASLTRRSALQATATSALAGVTIPHVFAANDDPTVRLGLIGCGGRGAGAVINALKTSTEQGPVRLHAMADVFEGNLESKWEALQRRPDVANKMDVPPERKFIGFDAYKQAIDTLRPGDIAIFTTPCVFRWVHYQYAIEKGINVFMEKPLTADGPSTRKMFALNEEAKKKNLKVGVGLMIRHCVHVTNSSSAFRTVRLARFSTCAPTASKGLSLPASPGGIQATCLT